MAGESKTDERIPEDRAHDPIPGRLRIDDPEVVVAAGNRWLRDYLDDSGQTRLIVGLSGGLDSTVTVLWAARAVGAERLTILSLPCRIRRRGFDLGERAVRRAEEIATKLPDADFHVLDIGSTVASEAWKCGVPEALDVSPRKGGSGVVFGNLQARIRAVRLRTFANARDGLVLGTGNLSERLLGYFTIGGDEEADLEILGDLFKTEVRQIAPLLEVPTEILEAEPSADLLPGQTDRKELGFTYREADRVLIHLLEALDDRRATEMPTSLRRRLESEGVEGVRPNVVRRVLDRVSGTAFKRGPTPRFGRDAGAGVVP